MIHSSYSLLPLVFLMAIIILFEVPGKAHVAQKNDDLWKKTQKDSLNN